MRIAVGCETSGAVRRAFGRLGHQVVSIDLLPADDGVTWLKTDPYGGQHHQGDLLDFLRNDLIGFDLLIAHPPCTYLSVSGLHWNKRGVMVDGVPRAQKTKEALQFVRDLMALPIEMICIENPVSCISSEIRRPDQIIQPYEFGHDASKKTCLWLKRLPKIIVDPLDRLPGRLVMDGGKLRERWSNQTDSGQNRLPPSEDRWKIRSETYPAISDAFALNWGGFREFVPLIGYSTNG